MTCPACSEQTVMGASLIIAQRMLDCCPLRCGKCDHVYSVGDFLASGGTLKRGADAFRHIN